MFLSASLFPSWLLFMMLLIVVLASNCTSAVDWAISVNNMMMPERAVKERTNINDDSRTCILKISERNVSSKENNTSMKLSKIEENVFEKVNAHQKSKADEGNVNNSYKDDHDTDNDTNSITTLNWNTRLVQFAEWHQVSSTVFTTTGVLQLTLESSTMTPVRLVVYIGTSSDLFCYSATLGTKRPQNANKTITVAISKMNNTIEASPFSPYKRQNSVKETTPNNTLKGNIIVSNGNDVSIQSVNAENAAWRSADSVEQNTNIDSIWVPSSFAPSCQRRLSKYLQSQIHYTDSSFQTTLLTNGSYKYYHKSVNNSKAHELDDKNRNISKALSETLFSTKPPCILTRVDRFEYIIDLNEQVKANKNVNCKYNTVNNNTNIASNNTINCNFTISVTVHIPEIMNTNPTTVSATNDTRKMFAFKITAAAIPTANATVNSSVDDLFSLKTTVTSTEKNSVENEIETENTNTHTVTRSWFQESTYTNKLNASKMENICTNVSLSPEFWHLHYGNGENDICAQVTIEEDSVVDNGLWRTSWLLLINLCLLICIVALVFRVYMIK